MMKRQQSFLILGVLFAMSVPSWAASAQLPQDGVELSMLAVLAVGIIAGGAVSAWKTRRGND